MKTKAQKRKAIPVYSGVINYFPLAILEIAKCSQIGNDQHNPDTELRWDREKSGDELDALMRHLVDHSSGPLTRLREGCEKEGFRVDRREKETAHDHEGCRSTRHSRRRRRCPPHRRHPGLRHFREARCCGRSARRC